MRNLFSEAAPEAAAEADALGSSSSSSSIDAIAASASRASLSSQSNSVQRKRSTKRRRRSSVATVSHIQRGVSIASLPSVSRKRAGNLVRAPSFRCSACSRRLHIAERRVVRWFPCCHARTLGSPTHTSRTVSFTLPFPTIHSRYCSFWRRSRTELVGWSKSMPWLPRTRHK